jgi:alkaline phosphatase D
MFSNGNRASDLRMQAPATFMDISRRRFLAKAGGGIGAIAAPGLMRVAAAQSWRAGNPFSLGVASGAPRPDGFVLWTRLAPEPLSSNPETPGGMSGANVTLRYEIATDPGMAKIVRRGSASAEQAFAYSVHLDVTGLEPGRSYWYRFLSGDAVSPTGRAITLPVAQAAVANIRFGFVCCSNYEHGYFPPTAT